MLKPPCTCRPTNVNDTAPPKGDFQVVTVGTGFPAGVRMRPPKGFSLGPSIPRAFPQNPPKFSLTWNSATSRANPRATKSPKKRNART